MQEHGRTVSLTLLPATLIILAVLGCVGSPAATTPPANAAKKPPAAQPKAAAPQAPAREPGFPPPRTAESLLAQRGFQPEKGGWHEDKTLGGWYSSSRIRFGGISEISYFIESNRADRVERLEYRGEFHNGSAWDSMTRKFYDSLPDLLRGLGLRPETISKLDTAAKKFDPITIRENGLMLEFRTEQYRNGGHELGFYATDERAIDRYKRPSQGK